MSPLLLTWVTTTITFIFKLIGSMIKLKIMSKSFRRQGHIWTTSHDEQSKILFKYEPNLYINNKVMVILAKLNDLALKV
jgi:hypothetical protein